MNVAEPQPGAPKSKLGRHQFSLRTLLLIAFVLFATFSAVLIGLVPVRIQKAKRQPERKTIAFDSLPLDEDVTPKWLDGRASLDDTQKSKLPDDIPNLVEALASINAPPKDGPDAEYPAGFDHSAQRFVRAARQKLIRKGVAAFPELVKHGSDTRYSYTEVYAVEINLSVGKVCEEIIEEQIRPRSSTQYRSRKGADGRWHNQPFYFDTQGGVAKWWAMHANMNLREMRIEATQWWIDEEEKTGFSDTMERESILQPLQAELLALKSQEPKK
jgi:hypothetical protein